jgi:hypothetical protein
MQGGGRGEEGAEGERGAPEGDRRLLEGPVEEMLELLSERRDEGSDTDTEAEIEAEREEWRPDSSCMSVQPTAHSV